MAIIADDDKLQQDPNQQAQGQGAPGISAGGPTSVSGGQSSTDVGSPVSTAGVGAGGTGGWTNIQAYIDANKADTGSAQALDKTVSGQFDAEKNAYTQDSAKTLGDAQSKVNADKIDNKQADDLINQAGSQYQYGTPKDKGPLTYGGTTGTATYGKATPGTGTTAQPPASTDLPDSGVGYQDLVGKVQKSLTGSYSGPKEYNYAIGNKAAEYGADVNDDQGFDGLMKHIYQQAAPGGLNSGQSELQKQLDVNNAGLVDKRKELQGKYSDLTAGRDKTVADTTAGLSAAEQQYRTNQNSLQDYLMGKSNNLDTQVGQAEADARAEYNNTYNTGASGHDNIFRSVMDNGQIANGGGGTENMRDRGVWGDNGHLTWQQLQREQELGAKGNDDFWYRALNVPTEQGGYYNHDIRTPFNQNATALKQFYSDQDAKYGDTADTQKRQFDAIQDFLNSGTAKKEQGFKVRG